MTHLQSNITTQATKLTPDQETKLQADLNKFINKYSRDMAIDSFSSVIGKLVQDQWGAHLTQRFISNFVYSVKEAQEAEKEGR